MKRHSKDQMSWEEDVKKIVGLGSKSIRKSYYPELREKIATLDRQNAFNKSILNAIPDCVIITDPGGIIIQANPTAIAWFGYCAEELIGKHVSFLESQMTTDEQYSKVTAHRTKLYQHKDGSTRLGESHANVIFNADGTPIGNIEVVRDISERVEILNQKRKLEEQVRQSQKMEALGTLAGGIAHDFNNILGAIYGYTELVYDDLENGSENKENLSEVLAAATRAKELVKQILAFSRKTADSRSIVQMQLVVGEALSLLRQTIPTNIRINLDIKIERDTVLADPTQIHQVVMNLCTNSYQAMIEKGGTLSISLMNVDVRQEVADRVPGLTPGQHVLLLVQDTGIGMAPEILMRVFEPFFTTKPVGKGTGMGMSVVHGIVTSHGGAIVIESTLGEGTKVEVYLPYCTGNTAKEEGTYATPIGRGERIMVVDDEPVLARITCRLLERIGYSAECLTTSLKALKRFEENPGAYDMVITDQTMPGMTGINLARNVLAIRPDIPVIICTGYSETLNEVNVIKAGVAALLDKPLEKNILAKSVRKALDR